MEEKAKIYIYYVDVVDENNNIKKTYHNLTQKEIQILKTKLKKGERVKYMPVGSKFEENN